MAKKNLAKTAKKKICGEETAKKKTAKKCPLTRKKNVVFQVFFLRILVFTQARFSLRLFCSMSRTTMIRRALHSPGSGRPLGYFICVV